MSRKKRTKLSSRKILLVLSTFFIGVFAVLLALSIMSVFVVRISTEKCCVLTFIEKFSKFETMKDPFLIFIQILSTIGGVFFGIRIDQWIDDKKEREKLNELWLKVNKFLCDLKDGVADNQISIRELAEYKIYWDSLQLADNIATRLIQEDECYTEISYVFSFLSFYEKRWNSYSGINEWLNNASATEESRIKEWISKVDNLAIYTKSKEQNS